MERFYLSKRYLCDVPFSRMIEFTGGCRYPTKGSENHPAFEAVRNSLKDQGYIRVEGSFSNGDMVLKDFVFNDRQYTRGKRFTCAAHQGILEQMEHR